MHIEVQVALNFVISYLYNKLPRRRVNIFGEELERALKDKFRGHWYPEKPFRGSAYRCLKTGDPIDPVLERAARESGVPVQDILENLPHELAVWVDPGEVSYRIGEKGAVKILFNDQHDASEEISADREVTKTFNPEAQCFRPIEVQVGASLTAAAVAAFNLSPSKPASPFTPVDVAPGATQVSVGAVGQPVPPLQPIPTNAALTAASVPASAPVSGGVSVAPGPNAPNIGNPVGPGVVQQPPPPSSGSSPTPFKGSPSPVASFLPRSASTLTFTTAAFAQTKFGSTKLKTNTKRANRMSPTEFSNYIKQRALQQQQLHHHHHPHHHQGGPQTNGGPQLGPQVSPSAGRSLSPSGLATALATDPSGYFFQGPFGQSFGGPRGLFDTGAPPPPPPVSATGPQPSPYVDPYVGTSKYATGSFLDPHHFYSGGGNGPSNGAPGSAGANAPSGATSPGGPSAAQAAQADKQLLDSFSSFGLGPGSQYQHLLVAN